MSSGLHGGGGSGSIPSSSSSSSAEPSSHCLQEEQGGVNGAEKKTCCFCGQASTDTHPFFSGSYTRKKNKNLDGRPICMACALDGDEQVVIPAAIPRCSIYQQTPVRGTPLVSFFLFLTFTPFTLTILRVTLNMNFSDRFASVMNVTPNLAIILLMTRAAW